ncbi:hypothetical protein PVL29_009678 [Vitis rotundifolia]|uniref:AAA+ ATPase domain-containing protein n=1 Tax=Vitis rotundifolia TaxID=103349 RepID=A0AA39DSB1_VITRO|nr:hypothetical protein PVL29_009678 [Vitis rotundifolia]
MHCVSPILDVATRLWDCTAKRAVYIRELEENLSNLSKEREEQLQSRRTHEVDGWLRAVQVMEAEVEEILQNGDQEIQQKCLGTCPKNCRSSYRLGKIVTKKIDAVAKLKGKGHFDVVAHRLPCAPVDERSMGKTVSLDLMFEKVRRCLEDEQVTSIGLYGIGGVGKTTLLQKINNEYFGKGNNFDVVIWIVVPKPISIEKIQEVILKKLPTSDDKWKNSSKEEKAAEIFKLLKAKNFVIFLDDMWERLDLLEVGIPHLSDQTKSKVILTTRSEQVCDQMEVHKKIRVECLNPDEAFALFCDKVSKNIINSHPDIKRLAEIVVEECKGLPLALIIMGRSMASRKTPQAWEQAIQVLKSYPAKFPGMGDQVFPILKFSYDRLDDDTIKSCFLYCSIFPEDHKIWNKSLIDLWIGEGLKLACLLEADVSRDTCKMHDVIRDMALRLSCDYGEERHKIFVLEDVKLIEAYETVKWKEAQRISLWHSNINEELSVSPCFLNLQTLILRNSGMKSFPIGFFQFMPVIRVLDLKGNRKLVELPLEICRLESLEYLNLAWTSIKKVPIELKNLTKLRCLILNNVRRLEVIPPNVISCLSNLQMFSMILYTTWDIKEYEEGRILSTGFIVVLQELECLQYLSEISISLHTVPAVQKFLTFLRLQKCIQHLEMNTPRLQLGNCYDLEHVKINMGLSRGHISNSNFHNLVSVNISRCRFLDLTWLIYASSLEMLWVRESHEMEEIIGGDECGDSKIEHQNLRIVSRLSICRWVLPFSSLVSITVLGCPNLRKLPFNSSSATNTLKIIKGDSSWWEGLEWENDNLNCIFS